MSLQGLDDDADIKQNDRHSRDDDDDDDDDVEDQKHQTPSSFACCCANLLDHPCRETPDAPCAVLVMPSLQNDAAAAAVATTATATATASSSSNNKKTIAVPLSYRQARAALLEHQVWLQQQIRSLCLDKFPQLNNNNNNNNDDDEIVIAYLSHNSIDLFLSVLACTSLTEKTDDATKSSNENFYRHGGGGLIIPALLNPRWTVQEMLSALQLVFHNENVIDGVHKTSTTTTTTKTLVLYGPGLEETAFQLLLVASAAAATAASNASLCKSQATATTTATICCQPIPSFALSCLWPDQRETISLSYDPPKLSTTQSEQNYTEQIETTKHYQRRAEAAPTITPNNNNDNNNTNYSRRDAIIVFTSGTSSRRGAKGVRLSHEAICVQMAAKCHSRGSTNGGGYSSHTALLASTLPFCHIGGLCNLWAVWMAGGRLIMPYNDISNSIRSGSFDPAQVFSLTVQGRQQLESLSSSSTVNTLVVVPAMVFAMEKYHQSAKIESSRQYPEVKLIVVGGQSLSDQQRVFCQTVFPNATLVQTYACTEAASSLTFYIVPKGDEASINRRTTVNQAILSGDCVGKPPPHVQLCLLDKNFWNEKAVIRDIQQPFTPGVIATRGPHVMNGYWKRARLHRHDGGQKEDKKWFVTNDLGFWDLEGNLHFCGRVNDAIRTGGETVMASEVEHVVLLHPDVEECAVFALPDTRFGETVACATVCRSNNACPSLDLLQEWCQKHGLARYKQPRRLFQVSSLPKNSSGKILKFLLVERFHKTTDLCSKL